MLHLYDTALGRVAPLDLRRDGQVSMYVCGATVYAEPHVGHGRFALIWDIVRRYLTWTGLEVSFVSNVTDIDDKIIARAAAEGRSAREVAEDYEGVWWEAMAGIGVARPDHVPHATAYIEGMVALIGRLVDSGHAYVGGDGVYFAAESVPGYGLLARQPLESLRVGARVDVSAQAAKRAPVDFALWKLAKPGEPSWDSPWGAGRPGWHTECVVMALDLLGDDFDVHGGGADLAFPHHENERAQAVADGRRFARRWVHSGMVESSGGEKMSKSLGNTLSLPELVAAHDPRSLRLLVLQSSYRAPMTITEDNLAQADAALRRLDGFARQFPAGAAAPDAAVVQRFRRAMDEDLDTPQATALLFDSVAGARRGQPGAAAAVWEMARAVGLDLRGEDGVVPDAVAAKAAQRDEARRRRDWATADRLRHELAAAGWIVEDTPEGTSVRR
ncbi:MAG TPA: cysteine--tRNA ligase [Acidimicrobiales bacterium]|nr:cysteine--tRNA ligase [Acidimicrobiales bacterium]